MNLKAEPALSRASWVSYYNLSNYLSSILVWYSDCTHRSFRVRGGFLMIVWTFLTWSLSHMDLQQVHI